MLDGGLQEKCLGLAIVFEELLLKGVDKSGVKLNAEVVKPVWYKKKRTRELELTPNVLSSLAKKLGKWNIDQVFMIHNSRAGYTSLRPEQTKVLNKILNDPQQAFIFVLKCGLGKTAIILMLSLLVCKAELIVVIAPMICIAEEWLEKAKRLGIAEEYDSPEEVIVVFIFYKLEL